MSLIYKSADKADLEEDDPTPEETEGEVESPMSIPDSERLIFAKQLNLALISIGKGISKGKSEDFGAFSQTNIFEKYINILGGILSGSIPSTRDLETSVKLETGISESPSRVNDAAKKSIGKIISTARAISRENFNYYKELFNQFASVLENKSSIDKELESGVEAFENTKAGVSLMSSEGGSPIWSKDSAYRIILKEVIPEIRSRFDLISRAYAKVPGSIEKSFLLGSETKSDKAILEALYYAIARWDKYMESVSSIRIVKGLGSDPQKDSDEQGAEAAPAAPGEVQSPPSIKDIEVSIKHYLYDDLNDFVAVSGNPGDSEFVMDFELQDQEKRFITIDLGKDFDWEKIRGDDAESLFNELVRYKKIKTSRRFRSMINNFVLENPYLRINIMPKDDLTSVFRDIGEEEVFLRVGDDSISAKNKLDKTAGGQTSPLYRATSPSGEVVSFTPADLVAGGGKIKGKGGIRFKPKNITSTSLADRVQSSSFGKVKPRKKRKR
jgi:hypothetical protein